MFIYFLDQDDDSGDTPAVTGTAAVDKLSES